MNEGFLGTAAPRYADLVLLLEIGMGLAMLIGAVLAHTRRFRPHALCQSAIALLNFAVIVLLMVSSFHAHVSPKIPVKLGKAYYALATAHGRWEASPNSQDCTSYSLRARISCRKNSD